LFDPSTLYSPTISKLFFPFDMHCQIGFYVLCGCRNKQQLYHRAALFIGFYIGGGVCLPHDRNWICKYNRLSFILKWLILLVLGWSDSTDSCKLPLLERSGFVLVVSPVAVKEIPSAISCNEQCNIRLFHSNRLSLGRTIFFNWGAVINFASELSLEDRYWFGRVRNISELRHSLRMLHQEWLADGQVANRIPAGTEVPVKNELWILSSTLKCKYITCQMIVEPLVITAV
jgi:hypothetical protein